jgi:hypothetical protein
MVRTIRQVALTFAAWVSASVAHAGMPSPLPSEDEWPRILRLNDTADQRLQVISFFLVGLLVCAAVVRWLWNYLARDLSLPRLRFGRAFVAVILWGLLFVIVLTMISGARELMTPGAWKKQGFTYKLADASAPTTDPDSTTLCRQQLEQLRQALWHFAATHQGRFPTEDERNLVPADLWIVPESGGVRFRYVPGQRVDQTIAPFVIAPELEPGRQLVLRTDGSISGLPVAELAARLASEGPP